MSAVEMTYKSFWMPMYFNKSSPNNNAPPITTSEIITTNNNNNVIKDFVVSYFPRPRCSAKNFEAAGGNPLVIIYERRREVEIAILILPSVSAPKNRPIEILNITFVRPSKRREKIVK